MNSLKRIFIVGHPGAGKALLAKTAAEKLGWQFIDADLGLEFQIGRPLSEILGSEGVETFYQCQTEILNAQLAREHLVVATDATLVCNRKNRELLAEEMVVFLQVSTSVQMERIARQQVPLLPVNDLKEFFNHLHAQRDVLFQQVASITLNTDDSALDKHVTTVVKMVAGTPQSAQLKLEKKDLTLFHKTLHTPVHLTKQQALSLKLLAQGKSAKEIARAMNVSPRTVENFLAKTMEIAGCTSSKELIVLYHGQH